MGKWHYQHAWSVQKLLFLTWPNSAWQWLAVAFSPLKSYFLNKFLSEKEKKMTNNREAQLNLQEKITRVWEKCLFLFQFCVASKYGYILIDTMAAVNQQVIVAVNMTTFLLLLSSFLLDLFSISEAVIFMEFPLPYQKPLSEPRDISFFLLFLTTKPINTYTVGRTC